jgi:hypothetical protein
LGLELLSFLSHYSLHLPKGKSLKVDGVMVDFCIHFWDLIGEDYFQMILTTTEERHFPNGVNQKLITLPFKVGNEYFGN